MDQWPTLTESTWDQSVHSEKVRQEFHAKKKKNNKLSPLSRAFFPTPVYYANEPGWNNLFHIPSLCKWTIKEQENILDNEREKKSGPFNNIRFILTQKSIVEEFCTKEIRTMSMCSWAFSVRLPDPPWTHSSSGLLGLEAVERKEIVGEKERQGKMLTYTFTSPECHYLPLGVFPVMT